MEVATANAAFTFAVNKPLFVSPSSSRTTSSIRPIKSSFRNSISTDFVAPSTAITSSSSSHFSGHKLRPPCLNPASFRTSGGKRGVVTMVIPFKRGNAREQPPPDLASYLFKNRIIYLGMPLIPSVTELMIAEFLYLQNDDPTKPIYMYINSTGTFKVLRGNDVKITIFLVGIHNLMLHDPTLCCTAHSIFGRNGKRPGCMLGSLSPSLHQGDRKLGYETEALAVYDLMRHMRTPIFTLCVGNAWGEAALLLAAGSKGNRSALPSSTIMIREPIAQFQGQASDVWLAKREITRVKTALVDLLAMHTEKTPEQIVADTRRPKYFSPTEAVEYGIIDKVIYNEKGSKDRGVVSDLQKA
ncbi:ATP-dependent clp protease proteolytic subunit-related protein chloroplastic-like [Trifolium pratense]|uniref:ATP-dependent Clp protease proteolytic subunit n=1 Tax=Trifolium pratense TaxID=57577 RepID=A0A2K3P3A7_TRIPR|nr:ATP-dependent clp protease proteolytic subunit-related protein chloroplastic-like [Trifolium pratense]